MGQQSVPAAAHGRMGGIGGRSRRQINSRENLAGLRENINVSPAFFSVSLMAADSSAPSLKQKIVRPQTQYRSSAFRHRTINRIADATYAHSYDELSVDSILRQAGVGITADIEIGAPP